MPLIKLEYILILDPPLDPEHERHLKNNGHKRIRRVYQVADIVQATATLLHKGHGAHEHNYVVNKAVQVQDVSHAVHQLVLDQVQSLSVVLEAESLVLVVDE